MDSSLSKVPPVKPSPLPEIIGTLRPQAANAGANTWKENNGKTGWIKNRLTKKTVPTK